LQPVRVLILVNQDVVEIRPHLRGDAGHLHGLVPIQQQIVVIEHVVTLFGGDISGKEAFQLGFPLVAPGEGVGQRFLKRTASIDAVGIDRQTAAGGDRIRTIGPARAPGAVVLVHADFSASAGEPT